MEDIGLEDHTVRISEETLKDLMGLKNKMSLSYNDIIAKGLKLLKDSTTPERRTSPIETDSKVYKIQVSLNRVRINTNVKNLLKSGYDLFIPDITPRQAMYIKRKFKSMGYDMNYAKSQGDGKIGFLFSKTITDEEEATDVMKTIGKPTEKPTVAPKKIKTAREENDPLYA